MKHCRTVAYVTDVYVMEPSMFQMCGTYSTDIITAVFICHIRFCNLVGVVNAGPYKHVTFLHIKPVINHVTYI